MKTSNDWGVESLLSGTVPEPLITPNSRTKYLKYCSYLIFNVNKNDVTGRMSAGRLGRRGLFFAPSLRLVALEMCGFHRMQCSPASSFV